jgi:hypothetical protein
MENKSSITGEITCERQKVFSAVERTYLSLRCVSSEGYCMLTMGTLDWLSRHLGGILNVTAATFTSDLEIGDFWHGARNLVNVASLQRGEKVVWIQSARLDEAPVTPTILLGRAHLEKRAKQSESNRE